MNITEKGHYDSTISTSKEASLAKAMEIMMDDIQKNQRVPKIVRPNVSLLKGIIPIFLFGISGICFLVHAEFLAASLALSTLALRLLIILVYTVVGIVCLKPLLIWLILIYQKYAPAKIRMLCYFEPSCSEYMKLSIQKYGVVRGVYKGYKRLLRCHWPNGGVDYP